MLYNLKKHFLDITGMDDATLQPAAGAHGEWTGIMLMREYHRERGELDQRTEIIVPDSAHGTNPASAHMAGFKTVEIPSNEHGMVDLEALKAAVGPQTAGLMLTNPNTIGVFESEISEISRIVHDAGTWALISSTATCTRPSARLTAAEDQVQVQWESSPS